MSINFLDKYSRVEGPEGFRGVGSFGEVFKARRNSDGLIVAVKVPKLELCPAELDTIQQLSQLRHDNVIRFYDLAKYCVFKQVLLHDSASTIEFAL